MQGTFLGDPGTDIFEQFISVAIEAMGTDVTLIGAIAIAAD